MSTHLTNIVWRKLSVSGAEKVLLLAIADISNDQGDNIHPSNEYLEWMTDIPLRTIQHYKSKWKLMGALVPIENVSGGAGNFVWYKLNLEVFPQKADWKNTGRKKDAMVASFSGDKRVQWLREKGAMVAQKGAMVAQKGCNGVQRNKEEPLEESQENHQRRENRPPSESVLRISQRQFIEELCDKWEDALQSFRTDNPRESLYVHVRIAAKKATLSYPEAKAFLLDHPGWKHWPDLKDLDTQQEIIFPEPTKPKAQPQRVERDPQYDKIYFKINPWIQMQRILEQEFSRHSYDKWLKPLRFAGVKGTVVFVRIPSDEYREVVTNFPRQLKEALKSVSEVYTELKFETAEEEMYRAEKESHSRLERQFRWTPELLKCVVKTER